MTSQDSQIPKPDEIETGAILIEPSTGTGASLEQEADAFLAEPAQAAEPKNAIALGIGLMLLGVILFVMNDVMGKWLVATYTVGQVLLIRSLFGLIMLAPNLYRAGAQTIFKPAEPGLQAIRAIMTTVEVACFYWAVSYLPLADVVTFYMATPIFVTALAAPMLGEKIEWQRMVAVLIGFCGVVVAMRPSSATFSLPAFIAIFGANAAMIFFGDVQERYEKPGGSLLPFWLGTIVGLVPWVSIGFYIFGVGSETYDVSQVPSFVWIVFASLFAFFFSFALNQWLQFKRIGKWANYFRGETTYVVLSLVAKSLLAWQIFANVLVMPNAGA